MSRFNLSAWAVKHQALVLFLIIATSIAPSWREVGQLGAIAVIRTFLNFFLERDLAELGAGDTAPPNVGRGSEPARIETGPMRG